MEAVIVVVGTRPEIIKMAPVVRALHENKIPLILVHCGQHYDYNMSQQFIEELELPTPDYTYKIKAHSQGTQTARIITYMERLLKKTLLKLVLVAGDTNGVLATALAAVELRIPIGHVEAGLRSFDLRMQEEAPIPVIYPMHPRTKKRLQQNRIYTKIKKYTDLTAPRLLRFLSSNEKV